MTGGHLAIEAGETRRRVGITRIHMEEDAGKLLHEGFADSAHRKSKRAESLVR